MRRGGRGEGKEREVRNSSYEVAIDTDRVAESRLVCWGVSAVCIKTDL